MPIRISLGEYTDTIGLDVLYVTVPLSTASCTINIYIVYVLSLSEGNL